MSKPTPAAMPEQPVIEVAASPMYRPAHWFPLIPEHQSILDPIHAHSLSNPGAPFLGARKGDGYDWMSRADSWANFGHIGCFLRNAGLKRQDSVGIFSPNRPEWIITEYGGWRQSIFTVPLYATLGPNAISYCLQNSETKIVFCDASKFEQLVSAIELSSPRFVETVVCYDKLTISEQLRARFDALQLKLVDWEDALKIGKENAVVDDRPHSEDIAMVLYTSGTTGTPKGAIVNHLCVRHSSDTLHALPQMTTPPETFVHLSFLPLAHSMEQCVMGGILRGGGRAGFFGGNLAKLFDDAALLGPTMLFAVPRVYQRFQEAVTKIVGQGNGLVRALFGLAYWRKLQAKRGGYASTLFGWDRIVLGRIAAKLGGKLRWVLSGSAPLDSETIEWLEAVLDVPFYQAYGLTETYAAVLFQMPGQGVGNVGVPMMGNQARVVAVPELGFLTSDNPPRGELLLKGPMVFPGYLRNEKQTKEVLSDDGWLSTGDIAQYNPNGTLSIVDRKKNVFKLSQGEYIAAERLEMIYARASEVAQVWVWGDSHDSFLVSIVVPKLDALAVTARAAGVEESVIANPAQMCKDERVIEAVTQSMIKVAKENGMQGFEVIKALMLEPEPWTPENDLVTPTLKLKRPQLKAKYVANLEQLRNAAREKLNNGLTPRR